jgi:hypothetical protein
MGARGHVGRIQRRCCRRRSLAALACPAAPLGAGQVQSALVVRPRQPGSGTGLAPDGSGRAPRGELPRREGRIPASTMKLITGAGRCSVATFRFRLHVIAGRRRSAGQRRCSGRSTSRARTRCSPPACDRHLSPGDQMSGLAGCPLAAHPGIRVRGRVSPTSGSSTRADGPGGRRTAALRSPSPACRPTRTTPATAAPPTSRPPLAVAAQGDPARGRRLSAPSRWARRPERPGAGHGAVPAAAGDPAGDELASDNSSPRPREDGRHTARTAAPPAPASPARAACSPSADRQAGRPWWTARGSRATTG